MEKLFKLIESGALVILMVFMPIKGLLITTGVMIFADLITGVMAARKRGEPIKSAALRRTVTKILVYEGALMLAFLAETYMSDLLPFVKMASTMIAVVELKSIYENMNVISGHDLFKTLIEKLGSANDKQSKQ